MRIPGVSCVGLFLNKSEIVKSKYTIDENIINLSDSIVVDRSIHNYIIIEFNSKNIKTKFWVPIIVAVIGLIGTLGQPFLHSVGALYKNEMYYAVDFSRWGYCDQTHQFCAIVQLTPARTIKHIPESELNDWVLYLALREETDSADTLQHNYKYFNGPFELISLMEKSVQADKKFTERLKKTKNPAQCTILLVKKGIILQKGFKPSNFTQDQLRVIQNASCGFSN